MSILKSPLRVAGCVALAVSLSFVTASSPSTAPAAPIEPQTVALQAWQGYLQQIGWPRAQAVAAAPRFVGVAKDPVANEHGGQTVTFDGSKPGMLATVRLVLDAHGRSVVAPQVTLADVLEAR